MRFTVWAPKAKKVALVIEDRKFPMREEQRGWWGVEVADTGPGTMYAFSVDDGPAFPDPRSAWQPQGVHGPSMVLDHSEFVWHDQTWQAPALSEAVIYELHIGTFTPEGTYLSAIERLDYLVDLGITHVELMPIQQFSGDWGWGYDGVDLFAPHRGYGNPNDLKTLVDACHRRGLAVLLDVVYNHLGPSGNYLSQFGTYFTTRFKTPWGEAVNLDGPGSDEVRGFFCDNAEMWLRDYHFDGLRIDAVHAFFDLSAIHFLEELTQRVRQVSEQLERNLVIIAESSLNDPRLIRSTDVGGFGMDAQWSDDFHHALHTVLTGEREGYYVDFGRLADLAKSLHTGYVYDGQYSFFRRRRHGRSTAGLSAHRFVHFAQNHDQIGNRAQGDRLVHLCGVRRAKIAAAFTLISPFIPMLFQGEEWGASSPFPYFTSHPEPELAKAVREGRQHEFASFGWDPSEIPDPQSPETFQHAKLQWDERDQSPHRELLQWHRDLLQLRKQTPSLRNGDLSQVQTSFDEKLRWFRVSYEHITIVCNLHSEVQELPLESSNQPHMLSSPDIQLQKQLLSLPANSVAILKR